MRIEMPRESLLANPLSAAPPEEILSPTTQERIIFITSRVFMGITLSPPIGALKGYIIGYGIGYGINTLLEKLPIYSDDPELAPLVAKIGAYTVGAIYIVDASIKSLLYSFDRQLSLRQFLIKALY